MIEQTTNDIIIKKMMVDSRLELNRPDFNSSLIGKIIVEEKRKLRNRVLLCTGFALSTFIMVIFLFIRTIQPDIFGVVGQITATVKNTGNLIIGKEFLLIPFLVILILQKIIGRKLAHSG